MHRLLTATLSAMLALSAAAAVPQHPMVDVTSSDPMHPKMEVMEKHNAKHLKALAPDAPNATLNISFVWDDEASNGPSVSFFNLETREEYYIRTYDHEVAAELPYGTYFAFAQIWNQNETSDVPEFSFLVKENISISEQTSSITFDFAEATNRIDFKRYLSDGQPLDLNTIEVSEDLSSYTIIEMGNARDIQFTAGMYCNGFEVHGFFGNTGCKMTNQPGHNPEATLEFLINDTDADIEYYQYGLILRNDGTYDHILFTTHGSDAKTVSNQGAEFQRLAPEFAPTPAADKESTGQYKEWGLKNIDIWKNHISIGAKMAQNMDSGINNVCVSPSAKADGYDLAISVSHNDYTSKRLNGMNTPVAIWDGSQWEYVVNNSLVYVNNNYTMQLPSVLGASVVEYPGHPRFSYKASEMTDKFGNSAPIYSIINTVYENPETPGIKYRLAIHGTIGRYGEGRFQIDDLDMTNLCTLDGEEIFNSTTSRTNFYKWIQQWSQTGPTTGILEYNYVNNNVRVDNLTGISKAEMRVDMSNDDSTPPTLTMLQMRNTDNVITDRFDSAENGVIMFSGGDFKFNIDNETQYSWMTCQPQTVKVEYRPYGDQGEWTEMEVVEHPEDYVMPGFGYFYTVSTEAVDRVSQTRWYDLLITLTDESGNTLKQTVSPAFRIDGLSGIGTAAAGTGLGDIYSMQGICLKHGASQADIDALAPGLYIIAGRKVIIR